MQPFDAEKCVSSELDLPTGENLEFASSGNVCPEDAAGFRPTL
jgi:hypothetical protein